MPYECQNFKPGQILTAGCMNKIDEWLEYICGRELTAVGTNANGELEFTFCNGTKLNCGVVGVTVTSVEQSPEDDRYNVVTFSDGSQLKVKNGSSGVYVGSGTPPANATVWINPEGEPTSTEDWEFDLDDGSTEEKTVVVVGSDDATASGKLAILRMKDVNGNWVEIPAIVGSNGKDGYTPQKNVDYFDGKDGVPCTHSWNGTTLTVTSASGTSSVNLKGDKGDSVKGDKGDPGTTDFTQLTNKPQTETWTFTLEDGSTVTKAVYVG